MEQQQQCEHEHHPQERRLFEGSALFAELTQAWRGLPKERGTLLVTVFWLLLENGCARQKLHEKIKKQQQDWR